MQANLVIIIIILKSMLIAVVVWTRLQSFCFPSDIGREVRGGEERSPREVQRQGGGETWSSKASNQHTGISFYSYCAKDGVRPTQTRPKNNIKFCPHEICRLDFIFFLQPTGRAEGESETQDRSMSGARYAKKSKIRKNTNC